MNQKNRWDCHYSAGDRRCQNRLRLEACPASSDSKCRGAGMRALRNNHERLDSNWVSQVVEKDGISWREAWRKPLDN